MDARRMLATDLDGTFIGDDVAMNRLWVDLERHGIVVVFATGRHLSSIQSFYARNRLSRRADACVCMVGTEIWRLADGRYRRDEHWAKLISAGWDKAEVERALAAVPGAVLQADEWQSPLKSSYFLAGSTAVVDRIRDDLHDRGLRAKVVHSMDHYLDVLPAGSGKGEAVRYLAETLGVDADEVVVAGDTGNDLDMMRPELGFRSIAVANATPELRDHDAPNLYHAGAAFADGIREGLVHFGWLPD